MPDSVPATFAGRSLPDDTAVVVFDREGFTGRPSAAQAAISAVIGTIVDAALSAAGLEEVRDHKLFERNTGDGLVFGCAAGYLPTLLHPFLAELQTELARHNATSGTEPFRLRGGLAVGPLPADGGPGDGNGAARNLAHRLVDSTVARQALAVSSPQVTHLVAIVSERVYQDAAVSAYGELHPARFTRVIATVPGKTFEQAAWLHVPVPSAGLLAVPAAAMCAAPEVPPHTASPVTPTPVGCPAPLRGVKQQVQQGVAAVGGVSGDINLSFHPKAELTDHPGPCR